jgi:hypothetical protein
MGNAPTFSDNSGAGGSNRLLRFWECKFWFDPVVLASRVTSFRCPTWLVLKKMLYTFTQIENLALIGL